MDVLTDSRVIPDLGAFSSIGLDPTIPESNLGDESTDSFRNTMKKTLVNAASATQNLQTFRQNNDLKFKEKAFDEKRKMVLEESANEIKLLKGKVFRRDKIIKALRNQVLLDLVSVKAGSTDEGKVKSEAAKNEEYRLAIVLDENANLVERLNDSDKQITRLQNKIVRQKTKIGEKMQELASLDFEFKEKLRLLEIENNRFVANLQLKDNVIEKGNSDLAKSKQEYVNLQQDFEKIKTDLSTVTAQRDEMLNSGSKAFLERDEALAQCELLKSQNNGLHQQILKLEGDCGQFKTRYEGLVSELDKMVTQKFLHRPNSNANNNHNSTDGGGGGGGGAHGRGSMSRKGTGSFSISEDEENNNSSNSDSKDKESSKSNNTNSTTTPEYKQLESILFEEKNKITNLTQTIRVADRIGSFPREPTVL